MVTEALFIATISVLLVVIGWIVVVIFKQKDKIAQNEIKNQTVELRHNDLVLEVASLAMELRKRLDDNENANSATRLILHKLEITLTKLDTTFNHFNKTLDKLTDDMIDQKEIIDHLRFKGK